MKKKILCMLLSVMMVMSISIAKCEDEQLYTLGETGLALISASVQLLEKYDFADSSLARAVFAYCASAALSFDGVMETDAIVEALFAGNIYVALTDTSSGYVFLFFDEEQTILLLCPKNTAQIKQCGYHKDISFVGLADDSEDIMEALSATALSTYWKISFSDYLSAGKIVQSAFNSIE